MQPPPPPPPPRAPVALDPVDRRDLEDYGINPDGPDQPSPGEEIDPALWVDFISRLGGSRGCVTLGSRQQRQRSAEWRSGAVIIMPASAAAEQKIPDEQ